MTSTKVYLNDYLKNKHNITENKECQNKALLFHHQSVAVDVSLAQWRGRNESSLPVPTFSNRKSHPEDGSRNYHKGKG